ncbi:MAG: hypothetical protein U0163_08420, partial [Gemmatimonadaceae bacterium]
IHQGLDPTYPHANDRIHSFILTNARELAQRADSLGYHYQFVLRRRRDDDRRVVDRLASRAALVVTDAFPTCGVAERTARFAERSACRVAEVESHAVVPSGMFQREEYAARTIRPKLKAALDQALEPVEDRAPRRAPSRSLLASLEVDRLSLRRLDVQAAIADCEIDHSVQPVELTSGLRAARARLEAFCGDGLRDYGARRPDPNDPDGTSRLSPYLHFGQIAPAEVVRTVRAATTQSRADAFLGEFLVWRELALNFCLRNPRFASVHALPNWARTTLRAHATDPRSHAYSLSDLEQARTHDALWNAAQLELVTSGTIHNYMRMLWGKSVMLWTRRVVDALAWLITLNDRYALDGRDPNSYAGIQWCFGKFDRPFAERPVLGMVRPMSLARAREKFDADCYIQRWGGSHRPDAPSGLPLFDAGGVTPSRARRASSTAADRG